MPISEVYNTDCMEYMKSSPDKFFELAVVDPPYGLDKKSTHGRGKLKDRSLNRGNIQKWDIRPNQEYFDELFRVSRNQIIWGGNYFNLPPSRGIVCWDKMQPWENFSQVELAWTSFDCPASLIRLSNTGGANKETKIHPTQKPVALYHFLLKKFVRSGNRLLDTHLGSGSSRIAAYKMGFDFWGTEIDKEYLDAPPPGLKPKRMGEVRLKNGDVYVQKELFEL